MTERIKCVMETDDKNDGPQDNNIVRYRGVSMRFVKKLMDDLVDGEAAKGVELLVLGQDIDVKTLQGNDVSLRAGTTVRLKRKLRDGALKCRTPYVGIFVLPKDAKYEYKPRKTWAIEDVCEYVVLEETRDEKAFYLDLLDEDDVGERFQGAFISQARKSDFVALVESLLNRYESEDLTKQFVWIDMFSANQPLLTSRDHDLPQDVQRNREDLLKIGLHDAIQRFDDRLIFFNSWLKPYPIERAWCVWEIFGCVKSDRSLDILFQPGEETIFMETLLTDREQVTKRIMDLRLEDAECFAEKDKRDIDQAVEEQIGYHALNVTISNLVIKWLKLFLHKVMEQKRPRSTKKLRYFWSRRNKQKKEFARVLFEAGLFLRTQLGATDEALELLQECLQIREKIYGGRDQPITASTLHAIASVLQNKGEYDAALEYLQEVLTISERAYGSHNHRNVALTLQSIAQVLQNKGAYDDALKQFEEVLRIQEKAYNGRNHPYVAATLHSIGQVLQSQGNYDAALAQFDEVVQIYNVVFDGNHHPAVATTLHSIAQVLQSQGKYETALHKFEKVLAIDERAYGGRLHPNVAATLISIGTCLCYLERTEEAQPLLREARTTLSQNNTEEFFARLCTAEGILFRNLKDLSISKERFKESLFIRQTKLNQPTSHFRVQETRFELALTIKAMGDDASPILQTLLQERKAMYPPNHLRITEIERQLCMQHDTTT